MKKDGTIAMFRYWNVLRAGRPVPHRAEIDPIAIKNRLPDTFILEFDEHRALRFRLAGTNICAIFARELRHLPFSQIWCPEDRTTIGALAEATLQQRTIVLTEAEARTGQGRCVPFEILLLPLDGGPDMPRAIGIVSPLTRPFWMGSHPIVELELISSLIIDPDAMPINVGHDAPSLAPDSLETSDMQLPLRRVRHLVVLNGGKA